MEIIYTVYTREINNETFYFVKKFNLFSEYAGAPKVLGSYAMHDNFFRACEIAKIYDEEVIATLQKQLNLVEGTAEVIPLNKENPVAQSILKSANNALAKLRLAGIN